MQLESRRKHGNTSYTFLHHISTMAVCTCTGMCEAFTLLTEIIYVQFKDMVYQQIEEIPRGTNCAPLVGELFVY